jgi:hypothetical protein
MRVDVSRLHISVKNILDNPELMITLDANFFLPPDRQKEGMSHKIDFEYFNRIWLNPFFTTFKNLAIHEAVLNELVSNKERKYVDSKISEASLILLCDKNLSPIEMAIRNTKERLIAPNTMYDPIRDNRDDRGEVKTLAYLGAKGYIYFASNDKNALRLVDEASKLNTSLDEQMTLKFYEGIFLLRHFNAVSANDIKWLYKYLYHLSKKDSLNPDWADFIVAMDELYH